MALAGFIFGNLDEEGEVEDGGVLDKVQGVVCKAAIWADLSEKKQLSFNPSQSEVAQLSRLGVLSIEEIMEGEEDKAQEEEDEESTGHKESSNLFSQGIDHTVQHTCS